jgi:hypothetical protein
VRRVFDALSSAALTVTHCGAEEIYLDYVGHLEPPDSTLSVSILLCGGMPGVEVIHPAWTSGSNGHLNGIDVTGNDGGVASSPTWSGDGQISWPKAAAIKEGLSHVVRAGSVDRYEVDTSEAHRLLNEQDFENPYISSHLDPRVDDVPPPEYTVKRELLMGHASSTHGQRVFKTHKPLPRRRHFTDNTVNLRSQFNTAECESSMPSNGDGDIRSIPSPSTPVIIPSAHSLLPTPPSLQQEVYEHEFDDSSNAETAILRSRIVTPTPQQSPPTPDNTPPRFDHPHKKRHFLGTQPSFTSTKAESFRTAREQISSEDEDEAFPVSKMASVPRWLQNVPLTNRNPFHVRPSPLAQDDENLRSPSRSQDVLQNEMTISHSTEELSQRPDAEKSGVPSTSTTNESGNTIAGNKDSKILAPPAAGIASEDDVDHSIQPTGPSRPSLPTPPPSANDHIVHANPKASVETAETLDNEPARPTSGCSAAEAPTAAGIPRRGQSLRERLEESQRIEASPSTEQFGNEIGWSRPARSSDLKNRVNSWRLSGISTTSTVEAIVVDREPKRQQTLRHRGRNASLRSASSPIPGSNRNSLLSNPESPPRLHHKAARLSNHNRWSFGSEVSRSLSLSSTTAPPPKPEIIRVAVIPERTSSLRSSTTSSNRHSTSLSATSGGQRSLHTDGRGESFDLSRHRRAVSESFSSAMNFANRGRDRRFPPPVPARSSSLSAPTSRSNSRANSITSEHLRLRRVAAEEDVRKTLARMESERSVPTENISTVPSDPLAPTSVEPDSEHWANMRPPSTEQTPFSQQSFHSTSPGVVEMGEARAVNLFPHNNHSLQIIESNPLPESRAVQELYTSGRDLQLEMNEPSTPITDLLPMLPVDSPLRNPRDPPKPPQFKVIPPTPASLTPRDDFDRQLGAKGPTRRASGRRFGSLKRPPIAKRRYSESFVKSFGRSLSLNAKNKKANQDLDSTLHPFWRPRGFWDGFSESDEEGGDRYGNRDRDLVVNNSLGMPQKRTIIDGPLSLVRKISDSSRRRRKNRGVSKRASYGSLSRLRMGRKIHKIPGLGLRFQVIGFRDLQQRMLSVKRRKEDERRDKRREELRRSIGPNVISQGDSRYISPRMIEPSSGLTPDMD